MSLTEFLPIFLDLSKELKSVGVKKRGVQDTGVQSTSDKTQDKALKCVKTNSFAAARSALRSYWAPELRVALPHTKVVASRNGEVLCDVSLRQRRAHLRA